jgi:hypothetical protein
MDDLEEREDMEDQDEDEEREEDQDDDLKSVGSKNSLQDELGAL